MSPCKSIEVRIKVYEREREREREREEREERERDFSLLVGKVPCVGLNSGNGDILIYVKYSQINIKLINFARSKSSGSFQ